MLSVDPILERMFFRSGADTLVVGRGGLETGLVLGAAFSVDAFFRSVAVVLLVPESLGAVGLGRLVAAPGWAGEAAVRVVVPGLAAVEAGALFGRLRSAAKEEVEEEDEGGSQWRKLRAFQAQTPFL